MLNRTNREEAEKTLENSTYKYNLKRDQLMKDLELMHEEKIGLKVKLNLICTFLNNVRNKPEELTIEIKKIKINYEIDEEFVNSISSELDKKLKQTTKIFTHLTAFNVANNSLLLRGFRKNAQNKKITIEAREKDLEVNKKIKIIDETKKEIEELVKLMKLNSNNLIDDFYDVQTRFSKYDMDYLNIKDSSDDELIKDLESLINQAQISLELPNLPVVKNL